MLSWMSLVFVCESCIFVWVFDGGVWLMWACSFVWCFAGFDGSLTMVEFWLFECSEVV